MTRFSIGGFVHFYRSLLLFYPDLTSTGAAELTYMLNTANLDSCRYKKPGAEFSEAGPVAFHHCLTTWQRRPYRTIVQLYRAMEALALNINLDAITKAQLFCYMQMMTIIHNTELRFYRAFDMEIDDKRTVYRECVRRLHPRHDEPGVCLLADWITLPTA